MRERRETVSYCAFTSRHSRATLQAVEGNTQEELERKFVDARRKIRAEAEEKLRALDIAWSLISDGPPPYHNDEPIVFGPHSSMTKERSSTSSRTEGRSKRVRITQEVKKAIGQVDGEFSQQDLSEIIESKYPGTEIHRGSVSNAISRIVTRGDIIDGYRVELAEEGAGSDPNVYKKVEVAPVQEEPADESSSNDDEFFEEFRAGESHVIDF
jgi:F0F1-type ATP synthase membrane subunit b/b'